MSGSPRYRWIRWLPARITGANRCQRCMPSRSCGSLAGTTNIHCCWGRSTLGIGHDSLNNYRCPRKSQFRSGAWDDRCWRRLARDGARGMPYRPRRYIRRTPPPGSLGVSGSWTVAYHDNCLSCPACMLRSSTGRVDSKLFYGERITLQRPRIYPWLIETASHL